MILTPEELQHLILNLDDYFGVTQTEHFREIMIPEERINGAIQILDRYAPAEHGAIFDTDGYFERVLDAKATSTNAEEFLTTVINHIVYWHAVDRQNQLNRTYGEANAAKDWEKVAFETQRWIDTNHKLDFDLEAELCGEPNILRFLPGTESVVWNSVPYSLAPMQYKMLKYMHDRRALDPDSGIQSGKIGKSMGCTSTFRVKNTMMNSIRPDAKKLWATLLKHTSDYRPRYYLDVDAEPPPAE